jgi:hypothetical protein
MVSIIIDPACNFLYSSYYLKGIFDLFPTEFTFSSKPFLGLKYGLHTHLLSFIYNENSNSKKVVIDFGDSTEISDEFLHWTDIYGKINLKMPLKSEIDSAKIVSLAPSFGLKLLNKPQAVFNALLNFGKCYKRTVSFRSYLSNYLSSSNRLPLFGEPEYNTNNNYVFFLSTYWESQDITNNFRINFIKACKNNSDITFEGGLVSEKKVSNELAVSISNLRIDYKTYISKIRRSSFVFNTPAYHLCHGWKLSEYLALGKAIISTPISNMLPSPLEHEKNIYYVSGETNDIEKAIKLLSVNHNLRKRLEKGAYEYYLNYVQPKQVIRKLLR